MQILVTFSKYSDTPCGILLAEMEIWSKKEPWGLEPAALPRLTYKSGCSSWERDEQQKIENKSKCDSWVHGAGNQGPEVLWGTGQYACGGGSVYLALAIMPAHGAFSPIICWIRIWIFGLKSNLFNHRALNLPLKRHKALVGDLGNPNNFVRSQS